MSEVLDFFFFVRYSSCGNTGLPMRRNEHTLWGTHLPVETEVVAVAGVSVRRRRLVTGIFFGHACEAVR